MDEESITSQSIVFSLNCLASSVIASWSLTQEVAGSNNLFYNNVVTEFSIFSQNSNKVSFGLSCFFFCNKQFCQI